MRFDWCRVKPDAPANSDPTAVQCTASSLFSSPRQSSPPKDPRQVTRTMRGSATILIWAGEAPMPTCWGTSRTRQMGWAPPASSSSLTGRSSWTCFFPSPGSPWQGCQGRWNHLYGWWHLCTVGRPWKKSHALGFCSTFPLPTLPSLFWTRFPHFTSLPQAKLLKISAGGASDQRSPLCLHDWGRLPGGGWDHSNLHL